LKVIIASATLDVETFYNFYNNNRSDDNSKDNVAIISVEGRNYPIDVMYLKEPCDNYINKSIETALKIHMNVSEYIYIYIYLDIFFFFFIIFFFFFFFSYIYI